MKKDTIKNAASPKWGLFESSFWSHPIRWLKDLKIYRDRIKHMKKYGYSPQAQWETFVWFIDIIRDILKQYRYNRTGTSYYLEEQWLPDNEEQWERNENFFNSELDKMLILLDKMDENNYDIKGVCTSEDDNNKMQEACEEFFKMFAKYFYGFWD